MKSEINAANEFNKFFCKQYSRVGQGNPNYIKNFWELLNEIDITISEDPVDINELKEVFFSLKANKSPGYDEINYNVIKNCFSELVYIKRDFHRCFKNCKSITFFKGGDPSDISNYTSIFVLPCFAKILERIIL